MYEVPAVKVTVSVLASTNEMSDGMIILTPFEVSTKICVSAMYGAGKLRLCVIVQVCAAVVICARYLEAIASEAQPELVRSLSESDAVSNQVCPTNGLAGAEALAKFCESFTSD